MGGSSENHDASNLPPDPSSVLNVNVGVLGHVDSGKTSLVKTLSTLLSTAALDKSKQSRQRGMTLDLGFSCFFLDMPSHLASQFPTKSQLQMTLVDCPGHASLIRTIIGGAQIIDMVLLVVDAFKGWQAQTTECLVLAELTSPHLVVALNKIDLFSPDERESKLEQAKQQVRQKLAHTRFANAPLIGVAACVGGEKVAAIGEDAVTTTTSTTTAGSSFHNPNETFNVETLVRVLQEELPPPRRTLDGPFYFAIDHCFPIRGQGTVLTGTVLSGGISVNQPLEFPTLGMERKVKSMQMFKRKCTSLVQGDRAGICVSNLDSKLIERGVAASPGAVQLLRGAIVLVRKINYYSGKLVGGQKFHISVGHTTVMATVTFWGARELLMSSFSQSSPPTVAASKPPATTTTTTLQSKKQNKEGPSLHSSALGGEADMAGLPRIPFDYDQDFVLQDELIESLPEHPTAQESLLHWAMLDFHTPVFCPLHSLVIGSRLDLVENSSVSASSTEASACRLAFSGRLMEKIDPQKDAQRLRLYTMKERRGVISRLGDPHRREDDGKVVRYEVFGCDLFKKETNMKIFVGIKVVTEPSGDIGEIKSSYGTSGKFRVFFPSGTEAREGDALVLQFKRYTHDSTKAMHQDIQLPPSRSGTRLDPVVKKKKARSKPVAVGEVATIKGETLENGKQDTAIISGFFTPEVNIREKIGAKVYIPSTQEEGAVSGPFGKAGKCKVSFPKGISANVGAKAELLA